MPQIRKASHPLIDDDLRPIYRALGVSEETIERAIQYSRWGPDERPFSEIKRRRDRPRENLGVLGQAAPAGKSKRPPPAPGRRPAST
jgi:hypothetical protein